VCIAVEIWRFYWELSWNVPLSLRICDVRIGTGDWPTRSAGPSQHRQTGAVNCFQVWSTERNVKITATAVRWTIADNFRGPSAFTYRTPEELELVTAVNLRNRKRSTNTRVLCVFDTSPCSRLLVKWRWSALCSKLQASHCSYFLFLRSLGATTAVLPVRFGAVLRKKEYSSFHCGPETQRIII
jgi:hypothetical protein